MNPQKKNNLEKKTRKFSTLSAILNRYNLVSSKIFTSI